jgi:hypothetical protein
MVDLGTLVVAILALALRWSLLLAWAAWWLWGVNWKKLWPALALGAWVPLVLLMVLSALVWSRLDPTDFNFLGFMTIPNFWWHLCGVTLVVLFTFACGWLQGLMGWEPAEVNLEPPAAVEHGHGHAHH